MFDNHSDHTTVIVLGGGPAGASAALELARLGIDTVLIEQTDGSGSPIGECLAPSINPPLRQLALEELLRPPVAIPSHGNRSSWGGDGATSDRDFLRDPFGHGWHLDRPAFNRALLDTVETAGITVWRHHRVTSIERTDESSHAPPLTTAALLGRGGPLCPPVFPDDSAENEANSQRSGGTSSPPCHPDRSGGTSSPQRVSPQNPLPIATQASLQAPPARNCSGGFRITTSSPNGEKNLHATMLVDATGRRSLLARHERIRRRTLDSQIAAVAFLHPNNHTAPLHDATATIEATQDGWWYAALLPDHRLAVVWFTDPDLLAKQTAWRPAGWWNLLSTTDLVGPLVTTHDHEIPRQIDIAPAGSSLLTQPTGDGWIAAGDAAASYDPLSSHGIGSALANGRSAARAIAATLAGDPTAFAGYRDRLLASYTHYLCTRHAYYADEPRWSTFPFWRRRHGAQPPSASTKLQTDWDRHPVLSS